MQRRASLCQARCVVVCLVFALGVFCWTHCRAMAAVLFGIGYRTSTIAIEVCALVGLVSSLGVFRWSLCPATAMMLFAIRHRLQNRNVISNLTKQQASSKVGSKVGRAP